MSYSVKIYEKFKEDLTPSERSECMAKTLSDFMDRMIEHNTRIVSRIVDLICENESDEKMRLDMLASHFAKQQAECLFNDLENWPRGGEEEWKDVTKISEFLDKTTTVDHCGVMPWKDNKSPIHQSWMTSYLSELTTAVRANADREWLGDAADTLELPTEFVEFLDHTSGVSCPNLDREMFMCDFGEMFHPAKQAQSVEEICGQMYTDDCIVAAGWRASDDHFSSLVYYLLCKRVDEDEDEGEDGGEDEDTDEDEDDDEPWQWRIFYGNWEAGDYRSFDSLVEFLEFYSAPYDWVHWPSVERNVGYLARKCRKKFGTSEEEEEYSEC